MSLYVIINLAVLAAPMALSFDKRVAFYRKWPSVILSSVIVGAVYIAWDAFAAERGDWWFNDQHIGVFRLFGLPLGEILFFFTVPFSCLFIYQVVEAYFRERTLRIPRWVWLIPVFGAAAAAVVFRENGYTFLVMLSVAVFFLLAMASPILRSFHFWLALGLSLVAFLIVNGVLTALPIISYGEQAIWGIRVYTIPLEDFFYCISLLGFNVLLYRLFRKKLVLPPLLSRRPAKPKGEER
jgi:lycopene cyclase domain-containing protein